MRAAHIRVRLTTSIKEPDAELEAETRRHLFLSFKEALNNLVKHSAATEVQLRFESNDAELALAITDNGRGFEISKADPSGNGLRGMRERILATGGRCEIVGTRGAGTGVHIHVSLLTSTL